MALHQDTCDSDEEGLQRRLQALKEDDPAYAAALNSLAVIKLDKGEVTEATRMFDQVRRLRAEHLTAVAQDADGAGSPPHTFTPPRGPPRPQPSTDSSQWLSGRPGSAARAASPSTPGAASQPSAAPEPQHSATSGSVPAKTPSSQTPPPARPRGGGNRGMGGGVAMFARALGGGAGGGAGPGRPGSARGAATRRQVAAAGTGSEGAADTPAAAETTPVKPLLEASGRGAGSVAGVAEAPAAATTSQHAGPTVVETAAEHGKLERHGTAAGAVAAAAVRAALGLPAQARSSPAPAAKTASQAGSAPSPAVRQPAASAPTSSGLGKQEAAAKAQGPEMSVTNVEAGSADAATEAGECAEASTSAAEGPADNPQTMKMSAAGESATGLQPGTATSQQATAATPTLQNGGGGAAAGKRLDAVTAVSVMLGRSVAPHPGPAARSGKVDGWAAATGGDDDGSSPDAGSEALRAMLGECTHVVEVHGLTPEVRTCHLEEFVMEFAPQDGRPLPVIKWVDDNHALLVCPDRATALFLLQDDQDVFRLRPFTEASAASRAVAPTELLPPRERPKTTAVVAKRMLSHALGMSQLRDRGAERELAAQRKAAREARREREQKLAAAWDDD